MHCDLLGLIQTDIEAGGRCDTLVIMLLSFALWPHNYLVVCLTRLGPHFVLNLFRAYIIANPVNIWDWSSSNDSASQSFRISQHNNVGVGGNGYSGGSKNKVQLDRGVEW